MKIPIVNEQDEIIGYKERNDRTPEDIIRVSGLWVTDKEGNILLAQRAFVKKHSPGLWGPAVAGTVEEGETYESNILKEAEEEIGLKGISPVIGSKFRNEKFPYFAQWFTIVINMNHELIKRDEEVENIKWFTEDEIVRLLKDKPEMFMDSFEYYINDFLNK